MEGVIRKVWMDLEPSAYEGFFDHQWARRTEQKTRDHDDLSRAVAELSLAWKSISNAFRYPWLLPRFQEEFLKGSFNAYEPITLELIQLLKKRLVERARESGRINGLDVAMEVVDDVRFAVLSNRKAMMETNIAKDAWNEYIGHSEFQLSIVGLMNQTYSGLFFAYEHFVLTCYRIVSRDVQTRTSSRRFSNKLAAAVGESVAEKCWNGFEMRGRSKIRNAIAHNGGKYTSDLAPWKEYISVDDEVIRISATENRKLYSALQANVNCLIDAVLRLEATTNQRK